MPQRLALYCGRDFSLLEGLEALLVEVELFRRDVQVPVQDLHEVALQLVDVCERDPSNLSDVPVCKVGVIEHLRGDQHTCKNEPKAIVSIKTEERLIDSK